MLDWLRQFVNRKLFFLRQLQEIFTQREKWQFFVVLVSSLCMAVFQSVGIISVIPFVQVVIDPSTIETEPVLVFLYQHFAFSSVSEFIVILGFGVLSIIIIGNIFASFTVWLRFHFVWRKSHRISMSLLKKYLELPYIYFIDQNTSTLGKNILDEVQSAARNVFLPFVKSVTSIVISSVIVVTLLWVEPLATLVGATALVGAYMVLYLFFSKKVRKKGKDRVQKNIARFKIASETLSGIRDIKILGKEHFFLDLFGVESKQYSRDQAWYQVLGQIPRYMMEMVAFGGVVLFVLWLIGTNRSYSEILPLIAFFVFAGYRLMPALQDVFNGLTTLKYNKSSLNVIYKDLRLLGAMERDIRILKKDVSPLSFNSHIVFNNVSFSFRGNVNVILKGISLTLPKNSISAFVGYTGAGKSTIIQLLLGLFEPTTGQIFIDDQLLKKENIRRWQSQIGYVPQEIMLFDDTILRNIALGVESKYIDKERVYEVAKIACIDTFIQDELEDGYDTPVGERGMRLSGGQRQRIGIARALYHDPDVLIFDEATSSLDSNTEKKVIERIRALSGEKTIIMIAHRLSTIEEADMIFVMEQGKIVDQGSYAYLEKNSTPFQVLLSHTE